MLLDDSLHDHVEYLKKTHSDRLYNGLLKSIENDLTPLGCSVGIKPKGGYFVWLKLPITGHQLMDITRKHDIDVGVGLGTLFSVTKETYNEDKYLVRLSFASYDTQTLKLGITRLKQALLIGIK
jgi:DNA-binding transcriptional MocR family regulator